MKSETVRHQQNQWMNGTVSTGIAGQLVLERKQPAHSSELD
jgi:hypothetical protein